MSENQSHITWSGSRWLFGAETPPALETHSMANPVIPGGLQFPSLGLDSTVMPSMLTDPYVQYQVEAQKYLQNLGDYVKKRLTEVEFKFDKTINQERVCMKLTTENVELRLNAKLAELNSKLSQQEEVIAKQAKALDGLGIPTIYEAFNQPVAPYDFLGKMIFTITSLGSE